MLLVLLEDLDEQGFSGIYLVRFGFRMWEIVIFHVKPMAEGFSVHKDQ